MEIKEFIRRMKEKGYDAGYNSAIDQIVISENDHHVGLQSQIIQKASYDEILKHVRYEIGKLKSKTKGNVSYIN